MADQEPAYDPGEVLRLEIRAGFAEVRAQVAEVRTAVAEVRAAVVEQSLRISTVIDSLADLRRDATNYVDVTTSVRGGWWPTDAPVPPVPLNPACTCEWLIFHSGLNAGFPQRQYDPNCPEHVD